MRNSTAEVKGNNAHSNPRTKQSAVRSQTFQLPTNGALPLGEILKLNGSTHGFGANFHRFLEDGRNTRARGWVRIDALCIEENDTTEKGLQVTMMDAIFSSADSVLGFVLRNEDSPKPLAQQSSQDTTWEFLARMEGGAFSFDCFTKRCCSGRRHENREWNARKFVQGSIGICQRTY